MHCSANVNPEDPNDVALFFGLSGTGKTTLSADPTRRLIGDDEHGWSDDGFSTSKADVTPRSSACRNLPNRKSMPRPRCSGRSLRMCRSTRSRASSIWTMTSITENTRASYPLEFIANAVPEKKAGHPKNIILLTCDASGVMPPIARLTPDQALYQFISGYTSKIAGTEVGLGKEPEITFQRMFWRPVHGPSSL